MSHDSESSKFNRIRGVFVSFFSVRYGVFSSLLLAVVSFGLILNLIANTAYSQGDGATKAALAYAKDGITAECRSGTTSVICEVAVESAVLTEAFTLQNPGRLVADFKPAAGTTIKAPSINTVSNKQANSSVKQIRFGLSAGTLRVVFDIDQAVSASIADAVITKGSGSAVFSIPVESNLSEVNSIAPAPIEPTPMVTPQTSVSEASSSDVAATPTIVPTEKPTKSPTPSPTPKQTATPVATATALPTSTPRSTHTSIPTATVSVPTPTITPVATVETPVLDSDSTAKSGKIEKVIFQKSSVAGGDTGGSTIRITMGGKPEAKVSKLDDRTYEVLIGGFELAGKYLALPYFPPEDFGGVTHVKLVQKSKAVQIIVGINRGTRIVPITKDGELILKVID